MLDLQALSVVAAVPSSGSGLKELLEAYVDIIGDPNHLEPFFSRPVKR